MATRAQIGEHELQPLRLLSRDEYERMVELGMFREERVELLRGVLAAMSPHGPRHAGLVQRLTRLLVRAIGDRAAVRVQLPLALGADSEPEPDLALVPEGDYLTAHPARALLVIEVADSSLGRDRGIKAELYAGAGVPEYWVVIPEQDLIEVHGEPVAGRYSRTSSCRAGESIHIASVPGVVVAVDDILR